MNCDFTDRRVDGCYGWIVVWSGFSLIVITDGILFCFGSLLVELVDYYDEDRATISLIGSLMLGLACMGGPISGGLCERFGCRTVAVTGAILSSISLLISSFATSVTYLYLTYGILGGTGLGFMYLSANVVAVQYFDKHRGLACGITLCGSGVGMFIFSLLNRVLINEYGWRGTVILQAGVCFQGLVFALLLLPPKKSKTAAIKDAQIEGTQFLMETEISATNSKITSDKTCNEVLIEADKHVCKADEILIERKYFEIEDNSEKDQTIKKCDKRPRSNWLLRSFFDLFDFKLLTNVKFLVFSLSVIAFSLAYSLVINMTVDRSLELGMTKYEASWMASAFGISSTIGRAVIGWFGDRRIVNRIVVFYILLLITGLATILSCLLKEFSTLVIYSFVFGFFSGGNVALSPSVLAELFSAELIAKSFGLYFLFVGISSLAATPIGGYLFDATGSYDVTFIVAGSEILVSGILVIILRCLHVHYRKD